VFKAIDDIYEQMFTILNDPLKFSYWKTKQRGFHIREETVLTSNMFPWAFIEWGSVSSVNWFQSPNNFKYVATFPLVIMTFADKADQTALVFNKDEGNTGTSKNKNPGIGDIVQDVGIAYWDDFHNNRFGITQHPGVAEVEDWTISNIGTPTILSIQTILAHPWIRGTQIDFSFTVQERTDLDL